MMIAREYSIAPPIGHGSGNVESKRVTPLDFVVQETPRLLDRRTGQVRRIGFAA